MYMKKITRFKVFAILLSLFLCNSTSVLFAQDDESDRNVDIYELSPFTVETDEDEGYRATATLAGTRIRTDLRDLASSISVVTSQFLEDTGARNSEDLLVYTTNTEVGGIFGNFAGTGNTQGLSEGANLSAPSSNTRVRGLDAADNTRNYFLSDIPWDSYIVDRVDLQRGPNSILFGVGSPAGIVNTSTIIPHFENTGKVENRFGSYGSFRNTLDYNRVILDDVLAVRIALLSDHQKFKQKPAFEKDERGYATVSYHPEWFGDRAKTTIRANFEKGRIRANRPRILTPVDKITSWWTGLGQTVWDPAWTWNYGAQTDHGNAVAIEKNAWINQPWLGNAMAGITGAGVSFFYDNGNSNPNWVRTPVANVTFGIGSDGVIDRGISGYTFSRLQDVAGFNEYSRNINAQDPTMFPGASKNFYKDIHLSDPSVFDFYNKLIDGDNKREWSDWDAYNVSIEQTFLGNRIGFEFVFDYQDYETGSYSLLGGSTFISIDVNTHTNLLPTEYPTAIPEDQGGGVPEPDTVVGGHHNPNVGRAYVSGGRPRSWSSAMTRENLRFTAFGEWYGSDFFREDSFLAKLIGRNVMTGLVSRDERRSHEQSWVNFATGTDYAIAMDRSQLVDGLERGVSFAVYLSDDLRGLSSPNGLDLPAMKTVVDPQGVWSTLVFDSHWNATGIDPSAPYILPFSGADSTQSENPANYVGLTQMDVNILNANAGDKDDLMTSSFKRTEVLDSYGLTWQAYWWDGMVVPTFGWRRDELETWGTSGMADADTGVRSSVFENIKVDDETLIKTGETISWGVVAHSEQWLDNKLPGNTNVSLFYNRSKNFQADNRVGFSAKSLPSPNGNSEDYGIVINTLDDRISLRVTWYTTEVQNANIGSTSPLGQNSWFLSVIEAWGTANALTHELYWAGELPGMAWNSNYGMIDEGLWGAEGWEDAPFSDEAINHPANQELFAAVEAWYATMPNQEFFDAYGLPIDRSKAAGSFDDRRTMIDNGAWNPYDTIGVIQAAGGGRINGLNPTMTINQESRGVEFELQARPIDNWNITFNASKTKAVRTDLGEEIVNWIEYQYARFQGPAGDMRLWWGGDQTMHKYYDEYIYEPYLFQLDANGQSAPEIRPWRFNLITNYSFEDGTIRGLNIGGALRWQDDAILGYRLDSTQSKLDVHNPIRGGAESNIDLWVGYERSLTDKIDWRIQMNLRNVGDDAHLVPISVNPDGSTAAYRIAEGMTWSITNTFRF